MNNKIIILLIAILTINSSLFSQEKWSLDKCINYALENNISIKQYQLKTDASKEVLSQSKVNLFPNLNANATNIYNFGKTIDPFTNTFASEQVRSNTFSISSSVVIFNGFKAINNIKKNNYLYKASKFDVEKIKNDIILSVASAYLQILYNIEILNKANNQLSTITEKKDKIKRLVELGSLAQSNLYDYNAQVASQELSVIEAENNLEISRLTLKQLLDINDTANFSIETPQNIEIPEDYILLDENEVLSQSLKNLPEIKSAENNLFANIVELSRARGDRYPMLTMSGSYGTGYSGASNEVISSTNILQEIGYTNKGDIVYVPSIDYTYRKKPFQNQLDDNLNQSFGIYLSIPIFNKMQINSSISLSKIDILQAQYNYESNKLEISKKIQQVYTDAKLAIKRYNASYKALIAYEESFKFANEKYDKGIISAVEYNEAWNNLKNIESDMIQSKYDFVFKIKILEFYTGKELKL